MRPVHAAALNQSKQPVACHPERSSWFAKRISYGVEGPLQCHWSSRCSKAFSPLAPGAPFLAFCARSGIGRDKNDYRSILAGPEGVSVRAS